MSGGRGDGTHAGGYDETLVLRPHKRLRSTQGANVGAAAAALLASVFYSLRFHGLARVFVLAGGVAVAFGVVSLISLSLRRTKLTMVGGQLSFTGIVRDRVVLGAGCTVRVVDVAVAWGKTSGRKSRFWLLIDAAGRATVVLNRDVWDGRQLEGLRERLGLPIEIVETPKRPAEMRKATPGPSLGGVHIRRWRLC